MVSAAFGRGKARGVLVFFMKRAAFVRINSAKIDIIRVGRAASFDFLQMLLAPGFGKSH